MKPGRIIMLIGAAIAIAGRAIAAPPPPGWDKIYRAKACGVEAQWVPVTLTGQSISQTDAGIKLPSRGAIQFAWAKQISFDDDRIGRPIGIGYDTRTGLVLATDRGVWLRIQDAKTSLQGTVPAKIIATPDGSRPVLQANSEGPAIVAVLVGGRSVVQYDLGFCGFAAKAMPAFHLPPDQQATTIGIVSPSLAGMAQQQYILVGGAGPAGYGEIAGGPRTDDPAVPLGKSFTPAWSAVKLLAGFDFEGGCDAVMVTPSRREGGNDIRFFCSPQYEDEPMLLAGDVGFRVKRSAPGVRTNPTLGSIRGEVIAGTEAWKNKGRTLFLLLTETSPHAFRVVAVSGKTPDYQTVR